MLGDNVLVPLWAQLHHVETLRQVDVSNNAMSIYGLKSLLRSSSAKHIVHLDISRNRFGRMMVLGLIERHRARMVALEHIVVGEQGK